MAKTIKMGSTYMLIREFEDLLPREQRDVKIRSRELAELTGKQHYARALHLARVLTAAVMFNDQVQNYAIHEKQRPFLARILARAMVESDVATEPVMSIPPQTEAATDPSELGAIDYEYGEVNP